MVSMAHALVESHVDVHDPCCHQRPGESLQEFADAGDHVNAHIARKHTEAQDLCSHCLWRTRKLFLQWF